MTNIPTEPEKLGNRRYWPDIIYNTKHYSSRFTNNTETSQETGGQIINERQPMTMES